MQLKTKNGITLIALVVTIIVLLILAGVSINMALGNNGIFEKAKETQKIQDLAVEKEKLENARLAAMIEGLGKVTVESYVNELVKEGITTEDKVTDNGDGTKTIITNNGYEVKISPTENGENVKIEISGDKTGTGGTTGGGESATPKVKVTGISLNKTTAEIGKGETTITATAADGSGKNASCNVTVTDPTFKYTETASISTSYVGYYADINGDGEITEEADGIIFADLLRGGSGQWINSDGAYSIGTISSAKSYKVSSSNYTEGKFGSAKVLQANGSGAARFYVMALKDLDTSSHCWYYSAYGNISDYSTVVSNNFGTGKTNTSTMITKWNGTAYGSKNGNASYPDVWGVVQTKYAQGWFVPSRAEWAAFGDAFNITSSNYSSTYGLSHYYWSSSLHTTINAWVADFYRGCMNGTDVRNAPLCPPLCDFLTS